MKRITLATLILAALGWALAAPDAAGTAVWDKNCLKCHGADGKGNPKIATALKLELALLDMTKESTVKKTDADLLKIIADGKNKMPGYKKDNKLSDADQKLALAHMRTLAPAK